jgi:hypothetical protein
MKRTIIGFVSALLVLFSVLGISSKAAASRREAGRDGRAGRALWI